MPIPMAARSKACVCGRSLAGITGSNPVADMYVRILCVVCCQLEVSATEWSPVQRIPTENGVSDESDSKTPLRKFTPVIGPNSHRILKK
jgi:hypothetical protein